MEEELPRGDGGAHDRNHKKDEAAGDAAFWQRGDHGVARDGRPVRMHNVSQRKPGQVHQAECDDDALPAQIASRDYHQREPISRD